MDFQLLQGGSRYGLGGHYCDETSGNEADPESMPLDEIVLVRGNVRIPIGGLARIKDMLALMQAHTIVFAVYALLILSDYKFFLMECKPLNCRRARLVAGFEDHFETLDRGAVATRIGSRDLRKIKSYSGYFAVLKGDGCNARAIFNGKAFSKSCSVPPTTQLPDFLRVIEALTTLVRDTGPFHSIVADVRHAFHQLPMSHEMSFHFCVKKPDDVWRWLVLPMGWSWSPFLCQSVGFGILLSILEDCGLDISDYKASRSPPSYVILKSKGKVFLVMTLWYDNIGIFTSDGSLVNKIAALLPKRFEKELHYYLKDSTFLGPSRLNKSAQEHPEYLGVCFRRSCTRTRDGQLTSVLEWQICDKKRQKWRNILRDNPTRLVKTCRDVARIIGIILWSCRLQYLPLCRMSRELDVLRFASALSDAGGGWDTPCSLLEADELLLRHDLSLATKDNWFQKPEIWLSSDTPLFLATDSSKPRWAYVYWDGYRSQSYRAIRNGWWHEFGQYEGICEASIFVKELLTAVIAIEHLCTEFRARRIILFIDNSAAAGVIRRLASTTHAGTELARRVDDALQKGGNILEVVQIASENNPADPPTRNKPITTVLNGLATQPRVDAMWDVYDEYCRGVTHHRPLRQASNVGALRHPEELTDTSYDSEEEDDDEEDWVKFTRGYSTHHFDDDVTDEEKK